MQSSVELRARGIPNWVTWLTIPDIFMLVCLGMIMSLLGGGDTTYTIAAYDIAIDLASATGVHLPPSFDLVNMRAFMSVCFAASLFAIAKSSNLSVTRFFWIMTPLNLYILTGIVYQMNNLMLGNGVVWQIVVRDGALALLMLAAYGLHWTLLDMARELAETRHEFEELKKEILNGR